MSTIATITGLIIPLFITINLTYLILSINDFKRSILALVQYLKSQKAISASSAIEIEKYKWFEFGIDKPILRKLSNFEKNFPIIKTTDNKYWYDVDQIDFFSSTNRIYLIIYIAMSVLFFCGLIFSISMVFQEILLRLL